MFRRTPSPDAIEGLFNAHFGSIYRFAACRVGRDAALDVAAETFAQALRNIDRFDPGRDGRPWLFGIATNVLRHYRRAEERRIRAYATVANLHGPSQADGHVEEAENQRAPLVEALVTLEARDREALLLFAWAELSYDEIAAALGIPLGTVRSRIHRARRLLRESLGERRAGSKHDVSVGGLEWTS